MDEKARALLAQLGITGQNVVKLPTGEFTGGGFVGPLVAAHLYRLGIEGPEQQIEGVATAQPMGDWGFAYYFRDRETANAAAKARSLYDASAVHRIELATRQVIASQETIAKLLGQGESRGFGERITGEVQVRTVQSKKYRHEWQLIGFPCLVSAAARLMGYDAEMFDISELRNQDTVYTDELFAKLCGNPDAKKGDEDYYTESVYWKQRASLWKQLGEDDPLKCHTKDQSSKFSTESDALDACLTLALSSWSQPIYGRIRLVSDPRVDAVSGDWRLNLGVVTDLYKSQAEAAEAAGQENGQGESATAGPSLPSGYVALGDGGMEVWKGELERTKAMPPAVAAQQVGADVAEVLAWREHLGL